VNKDQPFMQADTPVKQLEVKAIRAYREKFPAGPVWQELHPSTRFAWVDFVEKQQVKT